MHTTSLTVFAERFCLAGLWVLEDFSFLSRTLWATVLQKPKQVKDGMGKGCRTCHTCHQQSSIGLLAAMLTNYLAQWCFKKDAVTKSKISVCFLCMVKTMLQAFSTALFA